MSHAQLKRQLPLLAVLTLMLALIAPVEARKYPMVTEEGLPRVKSATMDAVYVMEGADFSGFDQVWLDDANVSFRKNWQRDYNRDQRSTSSKVRDTDLQKIRDELAAMFAEVFTEELAKGGYVLVDQPAQNVLRIRPSIIDLSINAPDIQTAQRVQRYAESAGEMTLSLELYDSESGALIAKAVDRRMDPKRGYMQWQTSVSNRQAAMRILTDWAKTLREGLDEARETSG